MLHLLHLHRVLIHEWDKGLLLHRHLQLLLLCLLRRLENLLMRCQRSWSYCRWWYLYKLHLGIGLNPFWHKRHAILEVDRRPSIREDLVALLSGSEDYPLAIAFAMPLRLDAVLADRSLLAALNPSFATGQTTRLCPFSGETSLDCCLCSTRVGADFFGGIVGCVPVEILVVLY